MPDVMHKGERLGKFRVQTQCSGHCAGNLRNLKRVGEPITKMIGIADGEDLGLGFEAAEGARMNDAVAIARVFAAIGMRRFRMAAAA